MLKLNVIFIAISLFLLQETKAQWTQSQVEAGRFAPVNIFNMNMDGGDVYFVVFDTALTPHQQAVYRSVDGGKSFKCISNLSFLVGSVLHVRALAKDTLLFITQQGICKKVDDSASKPEIFIHFPEYTNYYRPAAFFWGDSGIVVARHTYKTFDKGRTWFWDSKRSNPWYLTTMEYAPGSKKIIAASPWIIWESRNLGQTWDTLASRGISLLSMVNDSVGYAYGQQDLLKTTDGGSGWVSVGYSPPVTSLRFITENYGYRLIHGQKHVSVTTDGKNWSVEQMLAAQLRSNDRLYYFSDSMFFLTNSGNIYKRSKLALSIGQTGAINTTVYPNPAKDFITVTLPAGNTDFEYEISDLQGRIVLSGATQNNVIELSLSGFQPGIYVLTINTINGVTQHKIIKSGN